MTFIPYIVYIINGVYSIKDSFFYAVDLLREGYREKHWVFTQRNTYPVMVSSAWTIESQVLTYSPETGFGQGTAQDKNTLEDVVTAELTTPSGKSYDLSTFFYSVKWYSAAPSLYELVLVYFLHEKICLSTDMIDSFTLTVMTSDAEEHDIPLEGALAKASFRGFTAGLKVD
jgi:hypothetical protein